MASDETTKPAPRSFRYDEADGVATITLDRPERLNALTFEVYRELTDTFRALRSRRSVRVVVITGTGKGFCSGGDVNDIIGRLFDRDAAGLLAVSYGLSSVVPGAAMSVVGNAFGEEPGKAARIIARYQASEPRGAWRLTSSIGGMFGPKTMVCR